MEQDADELEVVAEQYNKFFPEVLDELERRCVGQAFSIWTGYAAYCEELAAVVLAPAVGGIGEMKARAERLGVEADADLAEQVREGLAEAWRTVEARGA